MRRSPFVALLFTAVVAAPAPAQLVTSSSPFFTQVLDLGAYSNGLYNFTKGPVVIQAGVTFVADVIGNPAKGSVIGQGGYGLGDNGFWGGTVTYIGLDGAAGYMRILFDNPVGGFGGFMNYVPGFGDVFIRALAGDMSVLESYNLVNDAPISTPDGFNEGAFRGIIRGQNDIYGFELANAYIVATDMRYGFADATTVPEPSTVLLLASGMLGVGLVSWRRRRVAHS